MRCRREIAAAGCGCGLAVGFLIGWTVSQPSLMVVLVVSKSDAALDGDCMLGTGYIQ